MAQRAKVVKVEVVSDTICPFCFLGKRRLEKAMRAVAAKDKAVQFEVTWKPFFLDSALPKEGVNKLAHYEKKFGKERTAAMVPAMKRNGLADGVNFSYGGLLANTLNSHRVIELALEKGGREAQDKVVEELFHNYFEEEKNIGDPAVLESALAKAGVELPPGRAKAFIEGSDLADKVNAEADHMRQKYAISGVPFFIVRAGGRDLTTVSGAQDPTHFEHILELAAEEAEEANDA